MKGFVFICFFIAALSGLSQKIHLTEVNPNYFRHTQVEGFDYLHEDLSDSAYEWIADASIEFDTILPNSIKEFYLKMTERANKMGANAFQVIDRNLTSYGNTKNIQFRFFYLNYEDRKENKDLFKSNTVYLFGFLGYHRNMEGYKLKLNNEKMIMQELRYKQFQLPAGATIHLQLSRGFKKNWIDLTGEEGMFPHYFKFNVYMGMFSQSVISEYDWSFAEFLIRVLQKEQITVKRI